MRAPEKKPIAMQMKAAKLLFKDLKGLFFFVFLFCYE